jgi:predicted transcriptional regulator
MPSLHGSNKVEELMVELEKEKKERKKVSKEKEDLEAELENLTQSLFEEVRCLSSLPSVSIVLHLLFGPSGFTMTDTFPSARHRPTRW